MKEYRRNERDTLAKKIDACRNIHFTGIGGISMSTIAALAKYRGFTVSGSDRSKSEICASLEKQGIKITYGHFAESADECDALVYTAAVDETNPEIARAIERNVLLIPRAAFLGYLMRDYAKRIGVSGTHGKTTTTALISHILLEAGLDPTVANGAVIPEIGGAYKIGAKDAFVYESCEYKDSFLSFDPTLAVITNIELDHTDYFESLDDIIKSFSKAIEGADITVANVDNANVIKALEGYSGRVVGISLGNSQADYYACDLRYEYGCGRYTFCHKGEKLCDISLPVIGSFNVYNSLCASAVAHICGVSPEIIASASATFVGAKRRFERKASVGGIAVYDDYAHHPSEISATLEGASRLGYKNIFCVFQPHTYSRTHDLLDGFEKAFSQANTVIFADIYAAREIDTKGVSSKLLADDMGQLYFPSFEEIAEYLAQTAKEGDLVLTMGAGDVYKIGNILIDKLKEKYETK
ncbi:MAG: UDP-N-acetylmuramate--L-alanine ligase [Ruminococcaceae bacterium]|nr:UDP-N-acetylmuramate--L-alanine ligase [Oscillospiraceae bacterium]